VVAFLVPGIGEKHLHRVEAGGGEVMPQQFHCVPITDADVVEVAVLDFAQQVAHARAVYLDADEIALRAAGRLLHQALAITKADLQRDRGRTPEDGGQVQPRGGRRLRQPEARHQFVQCPLLARGQPALPAHEAAHPAPGMPRRLYRRVLRSAHAQLKNRPLCGDDAEA
jgi:hypothetical protein